MVAIRLITLVIDIVRSPSQKLCSWSIQGHIEAVMISQPSHGPLGGGWKCSGDLSVHSQIRQAPDHQYRPKLDDQLYPGSSKEGGGVHIGDIVCKKTAPPRVGHPQGAASNRDVASWQQRRPTSFLTELPRPRQHKRSYPKCQIT